MIYTALTTAEYDDSYFDGKDATYQHNAGYSEYVRWKRKEGENSLGEYWLDYSSKLKEEFSLSGKVLEIGCAKGFVVEDLRSMGVNAYGLDVSEYAISKAVKKIKPYLYIGDARTYLVNFADEEFDVVFSLSTLECFTEAELPVLIAEMNRISKRQFHTLTVDLNPKYYLSKDFDWWKGLDWKNTELKKAQNKVRI